MTCLPWPYSQDFKKFTCCFSIFEWNGSKNPTYLLGCQEIFISSSNALLTFVPKRVYYASHLWTKIVDLKAWYFFARLVLYITSVPKDFLVFTLGNFSGKEVMHWEVTLSQNRNFISKKFYHPFQHYQDLSMEFDEVFKYYLKNIEFYKNCVVLEYLILIKIQNSFILWETIWDYFRCPSIAEYW